MISGLPILILAGSLTPTGSETTLARLAGDFEAEGGILARHRLLRLPALGEVLFLDWRDGEGRALRRRLLKVHRDEGGERLEIVLFRDAAEFAALDERPLLQAALSDADLRRLPESCRVPVASEEGALRVELEPGRCRFGEAEAEGELALEWRIETDGFEYAETWRLGAQASERLPPEGALRFRRSRGAGIGAALD